MNKTYVFVVRNWCLIWVGRDGIHRKVFIGKDIMFFWGGVSTYDKKCEHNRDSSYSDEEGMHVERLRIGGSDRTGKQILILGLAHTRIGPRSESMTRLQIVRLFEWRWMHVEWLRICNWLRDIFLQTPSHVIVNSELMSMFQSCLPHQILVILRILRGFTAKCQCQCVSINLSITNVNYSCYRE